MIATGLPPIAPDVTIRPCDIQEAFALCYLAQYNDAAIQPRVLTSMQRAYAPDALNLTQFVPNGRPGYCIASWAQPGTKKLIVAIEGIRSFASLRTLYYGLVGSSSVAGHDGRIWGAAKTYADQIWTLLQADSNFLGPYNEAGVPITFTGHSLGAVIAEILGEYVSVAKPAKARRVIKFGSPRLGNPAWIRGRSRTVQRASIYCDRDPVDLLPQFAPTITGGPIVDAVLPPSYVRDGTAQRYTKQGREVESFHEGGVGQAFQFARSYGTTMDTQNPWYDHQLKSYRLMFCNITNPWSYIDKWRIRYLEFNDENQWGIFFRPGQGITVDMETLNGTQPDAVPVDLSPDQLLIARQQADPTIGGTSIGGDWGGGRDDDQEALQQIPQPALPTMREVLAAPPVIFQPNAVGLRRRR